MDYSKKLMSCKEIYPSEWIKSQAEICVQWNSLSFKEKERKLCHDMCVYLLCNTKKIGNPFNFSEQVKYQSSGSKSGGSDKVTLDDKNFEMNTFEKFVKEEMKKKKTGEGSNSTINIIAESRKRDLEEEDNGENLSKKFKDIEEGEIIDSEEEKELDEFEFDLDHFYDPMLTVSEEIANKKDKEHVETLIGSEEIQYEYLPLETMSNSKDIVAILGKLWGIGTLWNFDIADLNLCRFIEVKTTTRKIEECYIDEWTKILDKFGENISPCVTMIIINLNTDKGKIISYFHFEEDFKMPGHSLVEDFIIRRKLKLVEITKTYPKRDEPSEYLFDHPTLKNSFANWFKPLGELREKYKKEKQPTTTELSEMSLEEIYRLLSIENPKERDQPTAKWTGKLLPYTWTEVTEVDKGMNDLEMSISIMKEIETAEYETVNWDEKKGESLFLSVKQLLLVFFNKEDDQTLNNFNFIDTRKKKNGTYITNIEENIDSLLRNLGIGMKKTSYKANSDGMKQEDYKPIKKKSFDDWMSPLMKKECSHDNYVSTIKELRENIESKHPIGEFSKRVCNYIIDVFQHMNAAKTSSKVINMYSRLGGSYLISLDKTKRTTHSSVSFFPIYSNCTNRKKEECKLLSGILIRAPQHVRDSTDKIGYIIIEKLAKRHDVKRTLEKGIVIGKRWWVKQNSIKRTDPTYLTFVNNMLFIPANSIGEIIYNHPRGPEEDLMAMKNMIIEEDLLKCAKFHQDRIIENLIMALLGGPQEEGFFASLRMLYMCLLQISKGYTVSIQDASGFIEGITECLISSPYVLWYHQELLKIIKKMMEVKIEKNH